MKKATALLVLAAVALLVASAGAAPLPLPNACAFGGVQQGDAALGQCEFTAGAGPHFYFTELDSLRVYVDRNNNDVFNPSTDTFLLDDYDTNNNNRVDPGPLFDRTEDPAGTFEVAAGTVVRVEAWPNGGSYLGVYFVQ